MSITTNRPDEYTGSLAIDHHTSNHAFETFLKTMFKIEQSQFVSCIINFYSEPTNTFNMSVNYTDINGSLKKSKKIDIDVSEFFKLFSNVTFEFKKRK